MKEHVPVSDLLGLTLTSVRQLDGDLITFAASDGRTWYMMHMQDCCESVSIEDICGDLRDLQGSPILEAEKVTNDDDPPKYEHEESYLWTFYKFRTAKGAVTIRWYGSSNGCYSEDVDFVLTDKSTILISNT